MTEQERNSLENKVKNLTEYHFENAAKINQLKYLVRELLEGLKEKNPERYALIAEKAISEHFFD